MSNLEPSVVALDSGLNLQTAKIIAPPGSVLDTLNYEQVDFQGQKRIDGYQRYDGSLLGALDEYYVFTLTVTAVGAWEVDDVVCTENEDVVGIVVALSGLTATLAIVNENYININLDDIPLYVVDDLSNIVHPRVVVSVTAGSEIDNAEDHYGNLLDYSTALRNKIESLPGGVIGLQWFRDRLYAVADTAMIFLSTQVPQIFPEDELFLDVDTSATVLDSFVLDTFRVVYLDLVGDDVAPWYVDGTTVYIQGSEGLDPIGTTLSPDDIEVASVASFFESRTEQQAIDEGPANTDYGWRFRHLGWRVLFEEGNSLFGSLPSTNQNLQNLGVQGPTSTTGNNGRPLILLQKVAITSVQTQVNGWKSTQTPDSYLLDPDDLTDIDSDYTYADAYFSWDGTSGAISQPGISSGALQEYSATATVEVDV